MEKTLMLSLLSDVEPLEGLIFIDYPWNVDKHLIEKLLASLHYTESEVNIDSFPEFTSISLNINSIPKGYSVANFVAALYDLDPFSRIIIPCVVMVKQIKKLRQYCMKQSNYTSIISRNRIDDDAQHKIAKILHLNIYDDIDMDAFEENAIKLEDFSIIKDYNKLLRINKVIDIMRIETSLEFEVESEIDVDMYFKKTIGPLVMITHYSVGEEEEDRMFYTMDNLIESIPKLREIFKDIEHLLLVKDTTWLQISVTVQLLSIHNYFGQRLSKMQREYLVMFLSVIMPKWLKASFAGYRYEAEYIALDVQVRESRENLEHGVKEK